MNFNEKNIKKLLKYSYLTEKSLYALNTFFQSVKVPYSQVWKSSKTTENKTIVDKQMDVRIFTIPYSQRKWKKKKHVDITVSIL